MREINIPLPNINDDEKVEIEVSVGIKKQKHYFRLESLPWETNPSSKKNMEKELNSLERIDRLKKAIDKYDKSWELIQIFAPLEKSLNIHILYRKK